jgi:glycosyltransferase involved in cell wall biosynthesis
LSVKVDVLGWNHNTGIDPYKRWLQRELSSLKGAGVDVTIIWPGLLQEPREGSILYIPFQSPTIHYLKDFAPKGHKMVIRYHDFLVDDGTDVETLKLASLVICDTNHVANRLREKGLKNVFVNHLTLDPSVFAQPTEFGAPVERNSEGWSCLWIGTEKPSKNLDGAIFALSQLPKDVTLRIVSDGRARLTYKHLVSIAKLEDRVTWLTQIGDKDLIKEYWRANTLLQVEHDCGFGMPVIEAMVCECPVIVGKNTPCAEVARGCEAAKCDTQDASSIAAAVQETREIGPALSEMTAVAATMVRANYVDTSVPLKRAFEEIT